MFTQVNGVAVVGIEGRGVRVEVDFSRGLRKCYLVGLPVTEVATVMSLSERTVKRKWSAARLWLRRELGLGA